jgi:lycopene cyclase domain-containing protein
MTYSVMNLFFLIPVGLAAFLVRRWLSGRALLWTAFAVLTATAIFDNYIIGTGVVAYADSTLSGIRIGLAPIEDFGYAIAAILGLPTIWEYLLEKRRKDLGA